MLALHALHVCRQHLLFDPAALGSASPGAQLRPTCRPVIGTIDARFTCLAEGRCSCVRLVCVRLVRCMQVVWGSARKSRRKVSAEEGYWKLLHSHLANKWYDMLYSANSAEPGRAEQAWHNTPHHQLPGRAQHSAPRLTQQAEHNHSTTLGSTTRLHVTLTALGRCQRCQHTLGDLLVSL
jgi:hypothetical protein